MTCHRSNILFDCIIFYFWLPEEELDSIFTGTHKWWFFHGLGYNRCVFYGPGITKFRNFQNSGREIYTIPTDKIDFKNLRKLLATHGISRNPILSIVVEGDSLPDTAELASASMPIQCFIADTHHMTNSLTSAILFVKKVDASMVFVSHSPHRKIFGDCINQNVYPLVYTPNDTFGAILKKTKKTDFVTCYYGMVNDIFHPERTFYLKKILETGEASSNLKLKPRMQPRAWVESLSKDLASFTCSLNGFPSVQSYAPFLGETCLVTDNLSDKSDLGPHLIHEENCLIYHNESEAIKILEWIKSNPEDVQQIASKGHELIKKITPEIQESLEIYCKNTNFLHLNLANAPTSLTKIQLNYNALTACYIYEIIQEVHRVCQQLLISIKGETEVAKYLMDYVSILPRAIISKYVPYECANICEDECIVWIANPGTGGANANLNSKKSFILRISNPKNVEFINNAGSGKWINPCSYIDCDFEGKQFPQFIPENISLEKIHKNESLEDSFSVLEILQRVSAMDGEATNDLLMSCVDLCVNDAEALKVADACDAFGLLNARKLALQRAIFLNRNSLPALFQLADICLQAGANEDAAILLHEAHRIQPLSYEINQLRKDLESEFANTPQILEYQKAISGRTQPPPESIYSILIVTNLFPPQEMGGYGRKIWEFSNGLLKRGHRLHILTGDAPYLQKAPDAGEPDLEPIVDRTLLLQGEWKDGRCQHLGDLNFLIRTAQANKATVLAAVQQFKPDFVLLGNFDFLGIDLLKALISLKIPVIHSLGNQAPGYLAKDSIESPYYIIAPASNWLGKNLLKEGYKVPNMSTVYPGARVDRFYKHFLPDIRKLRIAYAGLVMPYKGAHVLMDALNMLNQSGIEFEVDFAGDSTDAAYILALKKYALNNGLASKVRFNGFLDRAGLAALFARCNVLVFPTQIPEAFGISQVEAMASGLIVITSGTGGTQEVIRHGIDGLVFEMGNPASLAQNLAIIATNKYYRDQLQIASQKRAMYFSVEQSVIEIEKIAGKMFKSIFQENI